MVPLSITRPSLRPCPSLVAGHSVLLTCSLCANGWIGCNGGNPLTSNSACLSTDLEAIDLPLSHSTGLCSSATVACAEATVISSNFPGNGNTGADPLFKATGWLAKL